jgi:hypothetical protein
MKRFVLVRKHDVSGVSGTGIVAQGVEFDDRRVVLHWFGKYPTTTVHLDIHSVESIHGHGGYTKVAWLDDNEDYIRRLAIATSGLGPVWLGGFVAGPGNTAGDPDPEAGQIPGQMTFDLDVCA